MVERVHELFTKANEKLKRYIAGTLPLYVEHKGLIRHVTMTTIEEMMAACSAGKNTASIPICRAFAATMSVSSQVNTIW